MVDHGLLSPTAWKENPNHWSIQLKIICLIDDENGIFTVKGTSGKDHNVSFAEPSCLCRDWIMWHLPCKHFFSIFSHYSKWNWNSLPDGYLNGAYLSMDQSAIEDYFQPTATSIPPVVEIDSQTTALPEIPKSKVLNNNGIVEFNHACRLTCYSIVELYTLATYTRACDCHNHIIIWLNFDRPWFDHWNSRVNVLGLLLRCWKQCLIPAQTQMIYVT